MRDTILSTIDYFHGEYLMIMEGLENINQERLGKVVRYCLAFDFLAK